MNLAERILNNLLKNYGDSGMHVEKPGHTKAPRIFPYGSSSHLTLLACISALQEVQELESITGGRGLRDNALHGTPNLSTRRQAFIFASQSFIFMVLNEAKNINKQMARVGGRLRVEPTSFSSFSACSSNIPASWQA